MKKVCTVLLVQLLVLGAVIGQTKTPTKWGVGIWGGPTILFGDFNNAGKSINGWNMGFLGQKALSNTMSLRIDAGYAQYKDIEDIVRNGGKVNYTWYKTAYYNKNYVLNYKTYVYYGDILAQINLPIHNPYGNTVNNFNMYVFGGLGLNLSQVKGNRNLDGIPTYDTQGADGSGGFGDYNAGDKITRDEAKAIFDDSYADYNLTKAELKDELIEGWKENVEFILGVGANYRLGDKWEIFAEGRFAYAMGEDNFDGVRATSNGVVTGNPDILFEGRLGAKFRFGKKGAIDWFDNFDASLYHDTQDLSDKVDGVYADADGDGVPDYLDKDPETPVGAIVDGSGRPVDTDYDGVPDYMDDDIFTPKGVAVDENGVGIDSDGDGVADGLDQEPNTKAGALVNFQGIEIDPSGSGDQMPTILFDRGSTKISASKYASALSYIVTAMKNDPDMTITIVGHADRVGSDDVNDKISKKRAEAVKDVIVKAGISESRISTDSKGKREFLTESGDSLGDAMNRRAVILVD